MNVTTLDHNGLVTTPAEYARVAVPVVARAIVERGLQGFEDYMLSLPQAQAPVIHHYAPGQYIREIRLDAGLVAMGNFQKTEHLNVMLSGRVAMIDQHGHVSDRQAPAMFVGKPGRKIGYVLETSAWLNIYATDEQDVETLEAALLGKSETAMADIAAARLGADVDEDIADYQAVLRQFDFTESQARQMSERTEDMRRLPWGAYKIKVSDSPINGKGLFATAPISKGEVIAPALLAHKRTIAGRFTNHSRTPNAVFVKHANEDLSLVAIRDIGGCHGGFDGEEITIDYRDSLSLAFPERGKK